MVIDLTRGYFAIVDEEDYDRISQFKWSTLIPDANKRNIYAYRTPNKYCSYRYLHRMVLNLQDNNLQVDHINGNSLDNRKKNLRIVTHSQNSKNRIGRRVRPFKGITFSKRKKVWIAQICSDKRHIYVGSFRDKEDALKAYDEAALKYHGEFAKLNSAEVYCGY